MTEAPMENLDPLRSRLLREKLGVFLDWRIPAVVKTIGPFQPEIFRRYDERRRELVDGCR